MKFFKARGTKSCDATKKRDAKQKKVKRFPHTSFKKKRRRNSFAVAKNARAHERAREREKEREKKE